MGRPFRCARRRPRIHKPSKAVSFGLPDRLSICARGHAMVAADRGQTPTGKRQGQAATRPDPPSFGKCNGCEDEAPTGKTQEIKTGPAAGRCGVDVVGGQAKPDQYGRCIRYLGDGAARTFGCQAFLTGYGFAVDALWNFVITRRRKAAKIASGKNSFSHGDLAFPDRLAIKCGVGRDRPNDHPPLHPAPIDMIQFGPA